MRSSLSDPDSPSTLNFRGSLSHPYWQRGPLTQGSRESRSSAVRDMRPRRCSRDCLATSSNLGMSASFRPRVRTYGGLSLDDLVRSHQERLGNREAEGLGRTHVDDQLILARRLYG